MKCEVYRVEIEERAAGDALSAETSEHIGVCARCRQLDDQRASLGRLLGELKRVEAPNDFEFRLRARLAESEAARRPWLLRRGFVPGVVSIGLAALFFVTAMLTLQLRPRVDKQTASRTSNEARGGSDKPETVVGDEANTQAEPERVMSESATLRPERRGVERERRRAAVSTAVALVAAKDDAASKLRRERFGSAESEFRAAPYVNSAGSNQIALANTPVAVPLQASPQPLKVVLSDERGGARVVHMKTVSFGGQQLVGRANESARLARSTQEGAW